MWIFCYRTLANRSYYRVGFAWQSIRETTEFLLNSCFARPLVNPSYFPDFWVGKERARTADLRSNYHGLLVKTL